MNSSPATAASRKPGFPQGLFLILPSSLAVIAVAVFTATVALMQDHFSALPHSDYLVNLLQTMPGFWIVAFSPVAGWLADRFGRRQILLWALVVYAVAGVSPFFLEDIYVILLTRCLVGMSESVVLTVTITMLCDYFSGRTRDRWLATHTGFASVATLLVIPAGGFLGAVFGWQGPFLVYLVALAWWLGVLLFCWEPAHDRPQGLAVAPDAEVRYTSVPVARIAGILAITVIGSVMFYATITQNANAFVALGVTNPAEIGVLAMLASLGVPVGTLLFWILGRLPIALLLFIDFLLIGVGFTWMGSAGTVTEYVWAAGIQQAGCGLILPTLLVWAMGGLAYGIRGRVNGFWQGAFGTGLFISGAALTFLSKSLGGILPAFGVLGKLSLAIAAIAVVAALVQARQARRATA